MRGSTEVKVRPGAWGVYVSVFRLDARDGTGQLRGDGMAPTPKERSLIGRIGALELHAQHDSRALTQSARKAFLARFEREVDPEGVLPEAERARRADLARRAYFTRLAYKSARARRERREMKELSRRAE